MFPAIRVFTFPPPLAPPRRMDAARPNDEGNDADRVIQAYLVRAGTAVRDGAGVLGPQNPMNSDVHAWLFAFGCHSFHRPSRSCILREWETSVVPRGVASHSLVQHRARRGAGGLMPFPRWTPHGRIREESVIRSTRFLRFRGCERRGTDRCKFPRR